MAGSTQPPGKPIRSWPQDPIVMGDPDALGWFLVVEDDRMCAKGIGRLLEGHAPHVRFVCVRSGEQALDIAAGRCLVAALVDIELPGMSGFDFIDKLGKRSGRPIPVAVLTAHRDQANRAHLARADFILKPDFAPNLERFIGDTGVDRWSRIVKAVRATAVSPNPQPLRVLLLTAIGATREEIREELGISESTLVSHSGALLRWWRDLGHDANSISDAVVKLLR